MRALIAFGLLAVSTVAVAQEGPQATLIDTYNDWEAYRANQGGTVSCFIMSKPTRLEPTDRNHGDVFFFLTTRPDQNVVHEASVLVGYPFEENSTVRVEVDGKEFSMFTKEDGAWVESTADEQQLVQAMRAGSRMTVKGRSARGTDTSYTFSLAGVTAGSNSIANGCN